MSDCKHIWTHYAVTCALCEKITADHIADLERRLAKAEDRIHFYEATLGARPAMTDASYWNADRLAARVRGYCDREPLRDVNVKVSRYELEELANSIAALEAGKDGSISTNE